MFTDLVKQEKVKSREDYGSFNSMHEIYGVLMEEVDEFFDEVKKKPEDRLPEDTLGELVQIAAVVEMAAEDLGIIEKVESDVVDKGPHKKLLEAVTNFIEGAVVGTDINRVYQKTKIDNPTSLRYLTVKAELLEELIYICQNTSL